MVGVGSQHWTGRTIVGVIALVALVHFGLRTHLITDHRVDLGGAEINVVYGVQKIMLGRPLYQDPERAPFDVMQYTPAYYHVGALIGDALRMDAHDTRALFLLNRVLSLLLNLLTCWLMYRLSRLLGAPWELGAAVALITFTLFTEHFYGRVDALHAMLFVWALVMYVRWSAHASNGSGTRSIMIIAVVAVLCFFAKQTGALVLVIICTDLLLAKRRRAFAVFSATAAAALAAGFLLVLNDTTIGNFYANVVTGLMNGIGRSMYIELSHTGTYKYYIGWHMALVVLVIAFLRSGDRTDRSLAVAMAASFVFGLVTGLKNASNINYLFEAHVITLVAVARWLGTRPSKWLPQLTVVFLLYGVLFMVHRTRILHKRVGTEEYHQWTMAAYEADQRVHHTLVNGMGLGANEPILITYRGHLELLLNGQGLLPQKDIIAWSAQQLFRYNAFSEAMNNGTVRYVISDTPMDTLRFLGTTYPLTLLREVDGRYINSLPAR